MNETTQNSIATVKTAGSVPITTLSQAFLRGYPLDAARKLQAMTPESCADFLTNQPSMLRHKVWDYLEPSFCALLLPLLDEEIALSLLVNMDPGPSATLLGRLEETFGAYLISKLPESVSNELKELLSYPVNSAGKAMDAKVLTMNTGVVVSDALKQLKRYPPIMRKRIFTIDQEKRFYGQVRLEYLVTADPGQTLAELSTPIENMVNVLDPLTDVAEILQKKSIDILPVVNSQHHLMGVIRSDEALDILKEDMAANMQAMVGASREEQALSPSLFAFKKRQPWLQINLLTGFLAASIVGLFESTIAQFTALAVLMPVAAGQSGNTGAQALAVTMRGLTLREITVRHWLRVTIKEAGAGLLNGIFVAITCGLGVYIWSKSYGLALVIALAMIISMTIAGIAGALVPICLKKLGQDPAQSSSIILTTVTDIAGFMSFLGIAAALSNLLI